MTVYVATVQIVVPVDVTQGPQEVRLALRTVLGPVFDWREVGSPVALSDLPAWAVALAHRDLLALDLPGFIRDQGIVPEMTPSSAYFADGFVVDLGDVDDHALCLYVDRHVPGKRTAALMVWGCRCIEDEAQARRHWKVREHGMVFSTRSDELRPHALEVVGWVAGVSRRLGWDWHSDDDVSAPAPSAAPPLRRRDAFAGPQDLKAKAQKAFVPSPGFPIVHGSGEHVTIALGPVDGHDAALVRNGARTVLCWGCREVFSERAARLHWVNGRSVLSGYDRPNATSLIDFCAAICRERGWTW